MNHQRNKNIRFYARKMMTGNYPIAIGAFLAVNLISLTASFIATYICNSINPMFSMMFKARENTVFFVTSLFLNFILSLLLYLISVGSIRIYLTILSGKKATMGMLFYGFFHQPDKILTANLPITVISLICSIPSTILSCLPKDALLTGNKTVQILFLFHLISYVILLFASLPLFLTNYLLADDCPKSAKEIIFTSIAMMKGNKWRLFCLALSFLGWILLGSLTCGIGLLWITPYLEASFVAFYSDLKGDFLF